jgi:amino acid adenylation domain-containing protein
MDPAPLSFAQERLWFVEQLDSRKALYNVCRALRLFGRLNVPALERGVNQILRKHEVLRSAIRLTDDRLTQIVQPPANLPLIVTDLQSTPASKRERKISRRIQRAANGPFDFSDGKFLRAELIRITDDEHVLILTTHHIVSDAWSLAILTRELWSAYQAYSEKKSPMQELPIQYADFAVWQREWFQGEVLEREVSYWKEQLKNLTTLNLPTDRARPGRQSFRAARIPIALPEAITKAMKELSDQAGVTPFMSLLAAFQVLLYRYSGQKDIVVGSPIANRPSTALEPLIGIFVNMLVLRSNLSGNPGFKELLIRVREVCLGAYIHQDLPFEMLVRELQPERDAGRNPLFQVLFVLENATPVFTGVPDLRIESIQRLNTLSEFDISLFIRERDARYIGYFEYNTDLFDRDRIERMAGHYRTLLEAIVSKPDQSIATLPILTESERHQILVEWNDTAADYPKNKCIHHLFEEQVARAPEAIAVEFEDEQISYGELNHRANLLAHYITRLGIGPEKLVGIYVDRSIEMVVGLVAILKAGGAYVPFDPAYPKERLRFMLEDSQVSVLITEQKLVEDPGWGIEHHDFQSFILDSAIKVVCLDRDWPLVAQESAEDAPVNTDGENLAYVIYTSGSSGQPKGVQINHSSVVNLCFLTTRKFLFNKTDVWTVYHSYSFDFSVWEIWGCLLSGGRLVVVPVSLTPSPDEFFNFLSRHRISILNQTPTAIRQLIQMRLLESNVRRDLNLRLIICGGEILTPTVASSLLRLGIPLWNFYGPTEATVWSTVHEITSADAGALSVSIGRPLANTKVYILNPELQPAPIGVPGELCISGDGLARGYLNNPQLTAERFVPNPFEKDKRLYRTGDLARHSSDGGIQFLGRLDNQVKVRGYRVELEEIEATLRQHSSIKDAVVVLCDYPSDQGEPTKNPKTEMANSVASARMVAYIRPSDHNVSAADLHAFLREKLPAYMMPSRFLSLDAFPLSPNGKVDRQALAVPKVLRSVVEHVRPESRTPIEEMLAELWKDVLKLDSVGVNDNFFELGGHSLLVIQIISRVREVFGKDVSIHAMFETPTIAGIASRLENTEDGSPANFPPIKPATRDHPLPLSMSQEDLWHLDQIIPGTHLFNVPYVYRLTGDLNLNDLEKALQELIKRHEALRTVFDHKAGHPVQIIKESLDLRLPVIDLRSVELDAASERIADIIVQERTQTFDLALGPLIRTKLLCLTNTEYLLLVTMHHIITDEWSMRVFFRDLATLYDAYCKGGEPPLTAPSIQHADFAFWERNLLNRGFLDGQLNYWRMQLAGQISELEFRKTRKGTEPTTFGTKHVSFELTENVFRSIRKVAVSENCTPFVIVLAALNILVFEWTDKSDICVGTLMANRGKKESENVMGHFVNTVVLRNKIDRQLTLRQVVKQVGMGLRLALANQVVPFQHLAHVLKQERGIRPANLIPIFFIYHKRSSNTVKLHGIKFASLGWQYPGPDTSIMITPSSLVMNCWEIKTKIVATMNSKPDELGNEVVAEMVTRLSTILKRMAANMGETISSLTNVFGQLQHRKDR